MKAIIENCVFVISTFHKRHKYIGEILKICKQNMPFVSHFVIISDEDPNIDAEVFIEKEKNWAEMHESAFRRIYDKYRCKNIFFLLEDLLPFTEIDATLILKNYEIMQSEGIKYLSFRTYDYDYFVYDYNLKGLQFSIIPYSYNYYCQLQPAFWDTKYLINILQDLILKKEYSPWQFEFHKTEEIHLMSEYRWKNVLGGFIVDGIINKNAIKEMKDAVICNNLRKILSKEYRKTFLSLLLKKYKNTLKNRLINWVK